jgi:peptide-methionine (S)-S-oxide reductase
MGDNAETAVLAGGCFWGVHELMRQQPGVIASRGGWTGGDIPDLAEASPGTHAEAVEIVFDPEQTSFRDFLEFFFQIHDPTMINRQVADIGTEYRSAIFYTGDELKQVAEDTIADVDASGLWPGKVVTEIEPASEFWEAEERRKKRSAESADFAGFRAWLMTRGRHDSRERRANLIQKDH